MQTNALATQSKAKSHSMTELLLLFYGEGVGGVDGQAI